MSVILHTPIFRQSFPSNARTLANDVCILSSVPCTSYGCTIALLMHSSLTSTNPPLDSRMNALDKDQLFSNKIPVATIFCRAPISVPESVSNPPTVFARWRIPGKSMWMRFNKKCLVCFSFAINAVNQPSTHPLCQILELTIAICGYWHALTTLFAGRTSYRILSSRWELPNNNLLPYETPSDGFVS